MNAQVLVVIVAGFATGACQKTEPPPELYCYEMHQPPADPSIGINSLLTDHYFCFVDRLACEQRARSASTSCVAAGSAHWSCSRISHRTPTKDPMEGADACFPTEAMCTASRFQPPAGETNLVVSACAPVDAVYCSTTAGALSCYSEQAFCERANRLVAAMLQGSSAPSCTRRESAR